MTPYYPGLTEAVVCLGIGALALVIAFVLHLLAYHR